MCKHKFEQLIAGPVLTLHKCRLCGLEIHDVVDRGPNRLEIDVKGKVWQIKPQKPIRG